MPLCDLHVHSIRSTCGLHTLLEIIGIMKGKNIEAFALTDHSPVLDTPRAFFSILLRRIPPVIDGMRVFKGIETSILNVEGDIDLPVFPGYSYDIILAGLHNHDVFENNQGQKFNTRTVINALKRNPSINILTHPYYSMLPLDLDAVTDAAMDNNVALEINNSYILTGKADMEKMARLVELVLEKGVRIAVNSDGHVFNEIGEFSHALDFLKPYGLDRFTIVNRTLESTLEFLRLDG